MKKYLHHINLCSRISFVYPVIPVYRSYSHTFTEWPTQKYMREAGWMNIKNHYVGQNHDHQVFFNIFVAHIYPQSSCEWHLYINTSSIWLRNAYPFNPIYHTCLRKWSVIEFMLTFFSSRLRTSMTVIISTTVEIYIYISIYIYFHWFSEFFLKIHSPESIVLQMYDI